MMKERQATMRHLFETIIAALCFVGISTQAQPAEQGKAANASTTVPVPQAGTVFRDCPGCPAMVVIPAGKFGMGSPDSEDERSDDEGPVHQVKVISFALGKTEITRGQFSAFVKNTKYIPGDNCRTLENGKFEQLSGRNWRDLGFSQKDNHPVVCVSWNDASAYAKWMSRKTGKQYRLPSEAEWEYAARGRTVTARYWGNNPDETCRYANAADQTAQAQIPGASSWSAFNCTDGFTYTAPAGHFKANAFKLNDMLGNAWEWTQDNYRDNYKDAPSNGSAWKNDGARRVLRGGSWNNGPRGVRASRRGRDEPDMRFSNYGFRIARTLP
jgi:formylglycine-generating enzyme required for sulfatase activity